MENRIETIRAFYFFYCRTLKDRMDAGVDTPETTSKGRYINQRWFVLSYNPLLEKISFVYHKQNASNDYLYSFEYRETEVNVFVDDAGQQEYCEFEFNGHTYSFSGGAYQEIGIPDWCTFVDEVFEDAYFENEITEEEFKCTLML